MPGTGRKAGAVWLVTVVPDGTDAEAEAAARRARRLMAEWIRRGGGTSQAGAGR